MKMDEYNEMNTRIFNWKMMITYMSIYMNNWEIEITYIVVFSEIEILHTQNIYISMDLDQCMYTKKISRLVSYIN